MKRTNHVKIDEGATIFQYNISPNWYIELNYRRRRKRYSLKTRIKQEALRIARTRASSRLLGAANKTMFMDQLKEELKR